MDFWDKVANFYDITQAINGKVYSEMLSMTESLIPDRAKVLDTAAGTGQLSFAAAKKASEVVCTDLSVKMLENARKKAEKNGVTNIRFEARNIFHLVDEDDTNDVVMAGNVLHLLEDPQGALRELFRVTKKGGLLILPTYVNNSKPLLVELYKKVGFDPATDYTAASYRKMLEDCALGKVKAKLIRGRVPCCFAVMKKPE
ncbi:MAG: methyltransferase domain-containing protein [Ruminococcaceae bacterium]|nr:methyltransferase domain-containing protein [Oscillospiraceae bacterium]